MARVQFFLPNINDAFTAEAEPQEAIGIAAYNGSNDQLAEIFSKNPSLVTATDGAGRTALHWAVAGSQAMTVKYLLGRWSCADLIHAEDRQGSTPLMLYRGPRAMAALLVHGGGMGSAVLRQRGAAPHAVLGALHAPC